MSSRPGCSNGACPTTGTCIQADDFVYMLRHLAEAHHRETSGRSRNIARLKARLRFQDAAGFLRMVRARLECGLQDLRDWATSIAMFLCIGAFKMILRVVRLSQNMPVCCGLGRARADGQVNIATCLHWWLVNMIIQLQGLRLDKSLRQQDVCDFLNRHRISVPLAARVKKYIIGSQSQYIRESNVHSFQKLSTELLMDLLEEMNAPALPRHPFFGSLQKNHPYLVRQLCHEALVPLLKFSDEIVFSAGEPCLQMYFIGNGNLQYTINQQRDADPRRIPEVVRRMLNGGKWLSEAALWTSWVHRGELRVITDSLLLALDASGFASVISSHKQAHLLAAAYARKFVETLNRGPQTDLIEPATPPQTPSSAERAEQR